MRRFLGVSALLVLGLGGLAAGMSAASGGAGPTASEATTRVTVIATDFKFTLSKMCELDKFCENSVPTGTVIFTVVNRGKIAHDFKIAGKKTRLLAPGSRATLRVKFSKKGRQAFVCTLPGHAAAGMKGVLAVGLKTGTTTTGTTTTGTTTTVPGPSTTITVDMFEYRFELSQSTVPTGTITFVITNKGQEPHNFDVSGVKAGAILAPGQAETWTVGLTPKTYAFVCDVPFHIDFGMVGQLTVN